MRFVIAALAAFLVLMFDFDGSSGQIPGYVSTIEASPTPQDTGFEVASFADRFLIGSDALKATIMDDAPAPSNPSNDTADETAASATDEFCRALKEAAEANGIPVSFFARLIWQESNFRPSEVSRAGAQGVAQFMPQTAAEVGLDDPFDPLKALSASARLLRKLRNDFGNLGLAAAAYNAGSGRIQKWLSRQTELPHETRDYVRIITGTNPEDWIEDSKMLPIRSDLPREAPCAGIGGLSTARDFTFVRALPAAGVAAIIRKAEQAASSSRGRARHRLALHIGGSTSGTTRLGMLRRVVVGHAKERLIIKARAIRLASRDRSSS